MLLVETPTLASEVTVPLGQGLPTHEELEVYYPPKFTWFQLKLFVNSGDLGLLKRDKKLQIRYDTWAQGIKAKYGSMVNYLLEYRLRWGQPDKLSLLESAIVDDDVETPSDSPDVFANDVQMYFEANSPRSLICIIQNDWPYSVPLEIEHTLIWTRVPILPPPHLIPSQIAETLPEELRARITKRLEQDGIWGFTGNVEPPPSPSLLPQYLGALSEWGITMDKLIRSSEGSADEEALIATAGDEIRKFIKQRWNEAEWETAWFVNPPRLQSVKGLAHGHVFARKKSNIEVEEWRSHESAANGTISN
ncbi:hypothetical protein SCHPADRAFT_835514 [Schizopora paradoxa]|uniref:Uncharacterized protein n=1 Tax=Schizopora paradoxa TaxID=27342 RepID=A0A0H2RTW4_9AGAM|nr:hypothetical protein SCHPADRAFT_835514 [Schizopora paradoxa]